MIVSYSIGFNFLIHTGSSGKHIGHQQIDLKNFYKHFSNYTFYSTRSLTSLKKSNLALFGIADLHTSRENLSSKQDKQKRG